ncbi:PaaI family thioesterase [Janibacter indicus]|uniref:Uncharacterized domain 1-containing protein n=1 Tax=Janibacter indicus TaxID=857417 RepID=A0A1W2BWN1_9MICO|nr:hotdog fold thioesterase [Janibacter indicus]SMC77407.1 uncharacterized domain 1-containing protein [Janibacter indicus]
MTETPAPTVAPTLEGDQLQAHRGALAERMGIEILEAAADKIVARMPVEGNTQPYGILHGGASVVLAETLGSIGSALHAHTLGKIAVGLDINATHHRAAREGWVTGTAVPVTLGGSVACYEVTIVDDSGRRTCTSRITCILRPAAPGA